ncbi:hypothetical protein FY034_12255 [Trichlorobacter lovleyi]|uniref:beta strand repeat-containing protein n=1 Tax=Trichlorobacter lovleyi TaxID=313985 RepID=UPI00223FE23D|nr:GLUG motif-containing protein [Trichlorobacter lovleyi]QOX79681.1 hypothetical protein FY034_12255 [Trichlorobacter lovleyi]
MHLRITTKNHLWLVIISLILWAAMAHAANDFVVAPVGGDITGADLSARLAAGSVTLQSSQGKNAGSGNVIISDTVTWNANSTLTLTASNNVSINAGIVATGATAGLTISPNTANGSEQPSGSGSYILAVPAITLSGATPALSISGTRYTVINSLGSAADAQAPPFIPTLQGMAATANLSGNYALGSDIDATATAAWGSNAGFIPIGTSTNPFMGTFDGLGHRIRNITINLPTDYVQSGTNNYVGLFGVVGNGMRNVGFIRNIGLSGGSIRGNLYVGGLVGDNNGTISNSFTSIAVTGGGYDVGGLAGSNSGTITTSFAMGNVSATVVQANGMAATAVGGLVGENYGMITNSYATGTVLSSGNNVGGLVGSAKDYTEISNCYAIGAVQGNNGVGGLVGQMYASDSSSAVTITQSYATGVVTGSINTGGLAGIIWTDNGSGGNSITSSYSVSLVNSKGKNVGGLVGYAEPGSNIITSYWNVSTSGQTASAGGTGLTSSQMKSVSSLAGFSFATTPGASGWVIVNTDNSLNNAGGVTGATYPLLASEYSAVVHNAHQFQLLVMTPGVPYLFDVDPGAKMTSVNSYSGLNISFTTTPGAAGWVIIDQDGTMNNANGAPGVTLPIAASQYTTAITTIRQLQLMAMAPAAHYTLGATIDASATGNGSDVWGTGGFAPVGNSNTPFSGSFDGQGYTIANLVINQPTVSSVGLFGTTSPASSIKNVGLIGSNVSGSSNVGGMVGYLNGGALNNCFFTGNVRGGGNTVGGLAGASTGAISLSYATGSVSGAGSGVGGLVGNNGSKGTINNCYATGMVRGGSNVGGLVGANVQGAAVASSYAAGNVTGSGSAVGGLVGGNQGTVNNSYWNIPASGQTASAGGQGLNGADMLVTGNFIGFDFKTPVWVIVDNDGTLNNANGAYGATYPMLASEYSTTIGTAHQLQLMALNPAAAYTLNTDVDANGTSGSGDVWGSSGFAPVASYSVPFSGSFNGQGHSINNLISRQRTLNRVGLFGVVGANATVQNTTLKSGMVSGYGSVGALAGINYGTITSCASSTTVQGLGGGFIGGMLGSNNGTVNNSQTSGPVSGTGGFRGGFAGVNNGTISACSASGTVTGRGGYSGQLVGINNGITK